MPVNGPPVFVKAIFTRGFFPRDATRSDLLPADRKGVVSRSRIALWLMWR